MPLQRLYSGANELVTTSALEMHLISGANHSTHLNLVDANGNNLSCYVQVMAGGCARVQDPTNPSRVVVDRFTTMTVNSASRIGNANLLRLMVTDPVAQRRLLNERVGIPTPAVQTQAEDRPSSRSLLSSSSGSNTSTESMLSIDTPALPAASAPGTAASTTAALSCNEDCNLQCAQKEADSGTARSPRASAVPPPGEGVAEGL